LFAAVADYLGKPIGSVRLVIEGRDTTEPMLTQIVETVAGQPLSMVQVRETVIHLFSLGRFDGVSVDATLDNGRVALRYELVPIHPVARIRFAGPLGASGIDQGALHRAIVDRYGVSPPLSRLVDMARIIADELRERGYLHATITPRSEIEHAPERATLVFAIEPGPRTMIGAVEIVGRPSVTREELLGRLGLAPGAPYQREALDARIEKYVEERRRRGYYEAKIQPVVRLSDDDRIADLTLTVTPGPHVRVVFTGDPLPSATRAELVPVEREGSVDEDLLEDASHRIEEYWRAQGYRAATAPHTREESNGELVITFAVTRGQQFEVATFDISGNASVPLADLRAGLRLRSGEPFSDARLDADVQTIEDLYHRRGFASARAQSAVEIVTATPPPARAPVAVRVVVTEGVRTIVDGVAFAGNQALTGVALRGRVGLQPGAPYVPGQISVDRDAIQLAYEDLGYQSVAVDARLELSQNDTHVAVTFVIREGPQVFVDHVLIVGNVRTKTETIERELQVKPGDPFSLGAINESQRRLTALGLFRRARITELRHGGETTRDLLVTIEEAPPTTIGYGGGVEGRLRAVGSGTAGGVATERFEVAPRAFFEIGRRNVFGKNRSVNFFASYSHPLDPEATAEYRGVTTFREPRIFNTSADGFLNGTIEAQIRSSFNFKRQSASADIARHLSRAVSLSGSYQVQRTEVDFSPSVTEADRLLIDRTFPDYLLSGFSGTIIRDTRDDPVDPTAGRYVSANAQLFGRTIGGQVGFAKSFLTAQTFHVLPHTNRLVFAGDARIGLAAGFPRPAVDNKGNPLVDRHGVPLIDTDGQPLIIRDLPASERFYAGGDTTIRGFSLDRVGVRHDPEDPQRDTIDAAGLPKGGNGLVIFNAELRAPVWGGLGVVGFFDTGNVFARVADIDFGQLRSAVGGGVRYKSPFGPLRFDIGFKVHRQPGEGLTAWFVSFGQAF
jgi:outer membrane protein insertion porin family